MPIIISPSSLEKRVILLIFTSAKAKDICFITFLFPLRVMISSIITTQTNSGIYRETLASYIKIDNN